MFDTARKSCDPDFDEAFRLFMAMRDDPSSATARELVEWLSQCPGHIRAFDDLLTIWALAGGGMVRRSHPSILDTPVLFQ